MTEAGERLIEGMTEALAVVKGEQPTARLHVNGHVYVSLAEFELVRQQLDAELLKSFPLGTTDLVTKARTLVDLINDAERNHGGLWSTKTLRARDELALELSKWGGK